MNKYDNKKPSKLAHIHSPSHLAFIKQTKKNKAFIVSSRILLLLFLLGIWELLAQTKVIDAFIFSCPSRIVKSVGTLIDDGTLFLHIWTTTYETLVGFLLGTLLGSLFAVLLWWSKSVREILEPYIVILNSLPKIALGPILIVWVGAGTGAIIAMAVLVSVVITIITMLSGFLQTDHNKVLLLQTMNASKWQILVKLILPSNAPTLISTLKINVGMAWVGTITGEYLVSKAGLGYLIVYGSQVFKLDLVMASIIILCLLAALMYFAVSSLERLVIKWK